MGRHAAESTEPEPVYFPVFTNGQHDWDDPSEIIGRGVFTGDTLEIRLTVESDIKKALTTAAETNPSDIKAVSLGAFIMLPKEE